MENLTIDFGKNDLNNGDVREKIYMGHIFTISKINNKLSFKTQEIKEDVNDKTEEISKTDSK